MSAEPARAPQPVRIELATSEIEGGPCRAWADPAKVLAAVAVSQPRDLFERFIVGGLEAVDEALPGSADLPAVVKQIVRQLQTAHANLFSAKGEAGSDAVAITCAAAEEDRLFFVKSSPAIICILRDGKAYAVERIDPEAPAPPGLGSADKLRLEVTSLPVEPRDIVVMLRSEMDNVPDLRAIASVFGQTTDLKRACDGLVNLLGLQSEGAAAVAFRFIPVAATRPMEENPIADLGTEFPSVPREAALHAEASDPGDDAVQEFVPGTAEEDAEFMDRLFGDPPLQEPAHTASNPGEDPHGDPPIRPSASATHSAPDEASTEGPDLLSEAEAFLAQLGEDPNYEDPNYEDPNYEDPSAGDPNAGDPNEDPSDVDPNYVDAEEAASPEAPSSGKPLPEPAPGLPGTAVPVLAMSGGTAAEVPEARDGAPQTADSPATPALASERPVDAKASAMRRHDHDDEGDLFSRRRPRRNPAIFWPILGSVVTLCLVLLAAVPGGLAPSNLQDRIRGWAAGDQAVDSPGQLHVVPDPPARRVFLDGEQVAEGTPTRLDEIPAGTHRLGLDLGPCGMWETEIEIQPGETSTVSPKLEGSVHVQPADPTISGNVWVEGGEKIPVPTVLTGLRVGWNRIFYEDERLPIWERQVLVKADRESKLIVPNHLLLGQGLIKVESMNYWEGQGLEDAVGDSVWIDDTFAGVTPLDHRIEPGLHSVRVHSQFDESFTELIELRTGGTRYVAAQFGMKPRPVLSHIPPGTVSLQGPLLLSLEVVSPTGASVSRPRLHLPDLEKSAREVPLSQVEKGRPTYVALVEPTALAHRESIQYYFTAIGESGETIYSDLYSVKIQRAQGVSELVVPARTPPARTAAARTTPAQTKPANVAAQAAPAPRSAVPSPPTPPATSPTDHPIATQVEPDDDGATAEPETPAAADTASGQALDYPQWWP